MDDRHLSKAKRIDNGEWVIGFYACINKKHYIYTGQLIHSGLYDITERFDVDPSTICQCSGLEDDHDTLIFENDVLCLTNKANGYKWKAVIKFGDRDTGCVWDWYLMPVGTYNAIPEVLCWIESCSIDRDCKVIGNMLDDDYMR
jgi:hypothetical protein